MKKASKLMSVLLTMALVTQTTFASAVSVEASEREPNSQVSTTSNVSETPDKADNVLNESSDSDKTDNVLNETSDESKSSENNENSNDKQSNGPSNAIVDENGNSENGDTEVKYWDDGDKLYSSSNDIASVFDKAPTNGTTRFIELYSDSITINSNRILNVKRGQKIVLRAYDGRIFSNDKTISMSGDNTKQSMFKIAEGGELTIGGKPYLNSGGASQKLTINGNINSSVPLIENKGSLIIKYEFDMGRTPAGAYIKPLNYEVVIKEHGETPIQNYGKLDIIDGSSGPFKKFKPAIDGVTIKNNNAKNGGGIYNSGILNMNLGKIENNTATECGGAVYNDGQLNISGTVQIPSGNDNKNDIYLTSEKYIGVSNKLTVNGQKFLVTLKESPEMTTVALANGSKNNFTNDDLNKFSVNGKTLKLSKDLKQIFIPGIVATYSDDGGNTWTSVSNYLNDAFSAPLKSSNTRKIELLSNIMLSSNIGVASGKYELYAPSDKKITRGLAGYLFIVEYGANLTIGKADAGGILTIDGNKDNYSGNNSSLVHNRGTFTLTDKAVLTNNNTNYNGGGVCNWGTFTMRGGVISGNTASQNGSGVYNEGTFTMNGGTISGNTASFGGGVYNRSTFTMESGTINSNTASQNGSGVYNEGTFTMNGGTISGNTASFGGGVYNRSTFTMESGTINSNTASDKGGAVFNDYTFNLSGTAQIPPGEDGKNDIYLVDGKYITINNNLTGENQKFLVNLYNKAAKTVVAKVDGTYKKDFTFDDVNKFTIDIDGKILKLSDDKKQILINGISTKVRYFDGWSHFSSWKVDSIENVFKSAPTNGTVRYIEVENSIDLDNNIVLTVAKGQKISLTGYYDNNKYKNRDISMLNNKTNEIINVKEGGELTIGGSPWNEKKCNQTFMLKGNKTTENPMIKNYGKLTISNIENSLITGHQGGGIHNYNKGTMIISGGKISENTSSAGAGIYNDGILNITNGEISENNASLHGAGIYNNGTLNIIGGTIQNNNSEFEGSGIYNNSQLNVSGGTIKNNTAKTNGGGIQNNGTLDIKKATIENNRAENGGGIQNNGTLDIKNATIESNSAENGGGIHISNGNFKIMGSTSIAKNEANQNGGGIYMEQSEGFIGESKENLSSIIKYNTAKTGCGGGIYSKQSTLNTYGIIMINNKANKDGGGVYVYDDSVFNCDGGKILFMIQRNTAMYGGGIYVSNYCTCNINNGTINDNGYNSEGEVTRNGGGIYNDGTLNINKGRINSNKSKLHGGGIYNTMWNKVSICSTTMHSNTTCISHGGTGIYNNGGTIEISQDINSVDLLKIDDAIHTTSYGKNEIILTTALCGKNNITMESAITYDQKPMVKVGGEKETITDNELKMFTLNDTNDKVIKLKLSDDQKSIIMVKN